MNEKTVDNSRLLNLLAAGAFLWYFTASFSYLIFILYDSFGMIAGIEPRVLFWSGQLIELAVMLGVARFWAGKIWKQTTTNTLNTKRLLITMGLALIVIQLLQVLHGYYALDFLFNNFESSVLAYRDAKNSIDEFGMIRTLFDAVGVLLLLVVLVKWK